MRVSIVDAHCDTLARLSSADEFIHGRDDFHLDLPRLLESGVSHQIMAVCCEAHRGNEKEVWNRSAAFFRELQATEKPVLHFALEGCLAIYEGWSIPAVPLVASLTWNGDNPYAGGIGSSMNLTEEGKRLAVRLHSEGTALDVSHLNDRSRKSLMKLGFPVCATHCNARALCTGMNRNLPDEDLREIAARGGVVGVTFVPDFLADNREDATIEAIVNHVEYIAELTSLETVAFGSDFDGVDALPGGISGAESWKQVIDAFVNRGWPEEDIKKVAGENWQRFFKLNKED
ncbi:hypothetical protein CSA37_03125 [Candidatus Fermentibacteria bacterium]|nr:MAG: hypothetical protein CSA37_03125 [Candidatus Fermentibacteria bacterium]